MSLELFRNSFIAISLSLKMASFCFFCVCAASGEIASSFLRNGLDFAEFENGFIQSAFDLALIAQEPFEDVRFSEIFYRNTAQHGIRGCINVGGQQGGEFVDGGAEFFRPVCMESRIHGVGKITNFRRADSVLLLLVDTGHYIAFVAEYVEYAGLHPFSAFYAPCEGDDALGEHLFDGGRPERGLLAFWR